MGVYMKKFIRDIILISLLTVLSLLGIFFAIQSIPPQFSDTYDAAVLDKYQRLISIKSPKMILIAGSNFAFGIDSEKLQDAFEMPVVNLGLHAGIKPHFTLAMAKENIQEGDIIVIGIEYGEYYKRQIDVPTLLTTVENYSDLWKFVSITDYPRIFKGYVSDYGTLKIDRYLHGAEPSQGVYARASFNEFGDIEYERPANERTDYEATVEILSDKISGSLIKELNQFNQYAQKQGAKVYLTFPSLDEATVISNEEERKDFVATLEKQLDFPIISNMEDYIMPSELFYNSDYHLNEEGREIRTTKLIQDLKEMLD
ncbi:MAG: hypothetical protein PHY47_10505 [Lachnospiraceae bacterium]|nr:hypothetical protein [Lachnospiraceae bacterium]